ncbi:hypothetical protein QAD02_016923 [Eretmocerus hayati]|uniref:Uncharacterized protein n=1 Tax=Eretmocerus hayati TaxID=131215 RepID=A0ACC2PDP7_9HYME|nr:hypothetical protein QAD02_016923 [Eretmocerus hayati]
MKVNSMKRYGKPILYTAIFLLGLTFIPGIPPHAKYTEYHITEPRELETFAGLNPRGLDNPQFIFHGKIKGPQSFASYEGKLYTGSRGGYVLRIDENQLVPVAYYGKDCDSSWENPECARPMDLKFDGNGYLYVCDAYYGIFKINVTTGIYEQIVYSSEAIEGVTPKLINSLDIDRNGHIYWTETSSDFNLRNLIYYCFADPSGRLILYNSTSKKNQVLIRDIAANGVALSENEDFVIVGDTTRHQIIKYNIKGPKMGTSELLIDGLPGAPEHIHSDGNGGFVMPLLKFPIYPWGRPDFPNFRRLTARFIYFFQSPLRWIESSGNYGLIKWLPNFQNVKSTAFFMKKIAIVVRFTSNGEILETSHNSDKEISFTTTAHVHDQFLWLGSPIPEFLTRVPLKQALPQLVATNTFKVTPNDPDDCLLEKQNM